MAHKNSHSAPRKKGEALKIVLVLLVLLLVVAGGGVWMAKREIDGGTPGEEVPVSIQQGSGVSTIANALKEAGGINSRACSAGMWANREPPQNCSTASLRLRPAAPTTT